MPLALVVVPWVGGLAPWCLPGPGEVLMPWENAWCRGIAWRPWLIEAGVGEVIPALGGTAGELL